MSDPQSVGRNHSKLNYKAFLAIMVTVISCIFPIIFIGMWYFFASFGGDDVEYLKPLVDENVLHRMIWLWGIFPKLWFTEIAAALFVMHICRDTSFKRIATFGFSVSLCGLFVLSPLYIGRIYPNREKARHAACLSNIKQINLALMMYADEYDGHLPPPAIWNEASNEYVKSSKMYTCPSAGLYSTLPSYSINRELIGIRIGELRHAHNVVLTYESISGKNLSGGPELLPSPPRHNGGENIGFTDGHAKWYKDEDARKLNWMNGRD